MKRMMAIVCLILVAILVTGCASDEERIVGSWRWEEKPSITFKFYENGTCIAYENGEPASEMGYWYIDDDRLVIDGQRMQYSVNGNTLTFKNNGETITLKKTK